jgi:hypothetical protein
MTDSVEIRMYSLACVFVKIHKSSFITEWQHNSCVAHRGFKKICVIRDLKKHS